MPANESPYSLRSKGKVESIEEADLSSVSTSLFPPSSPSSLSSFATTRQQKKLVKLQEQRERRKEEEEDRVRKIPFHLLSDKNVNEWLRKQKLRSKVRQRNTRVSRQPNEQNEIEHLMARGVTELGTHAFRNLNSDTN